MADKDTGEREEAATPKRLKEARDKGQVARSKELTTALLLMSAAAALYGFSSSIGSQMGQLAKKAFSPDKKSIFEPSQLVSVLSELFIQAGLAVAPFFILLFVIGFFSPLLLGGLSFSSKTLSPKASRMSITKGIKRMFGLHALIELIKALAKILVVFIIGYLVISNAYPSLVELGNGQVKQSVSQAMDIVSESFFFLSLSLIVITLIDVPYQIWNHAKELKMSKQEIKDEFKETEGKPEVKSKIKQKQREISQQRMMDAVPEADVVVTNPEHFSVALKYDLMKTSAPIVVAKGADLTALQIRKVAIANDVYILAMPPLSRALFYTTEINQEVPQGLYLAVAKVLAFVFQLKSFEQGKSSRPDKIKSVDLPEEFRY